MEIIFAIAFCIVVNYLITSMQMQHISKEFLKAYKDLGESSIEMDDTTNQRINDLIDALTNNKHR